MFVSGLVQGVGYRVTMRRIAREHGVSGWVRNLADGRVEAEVEGVADAVEDVTSWMSRGPTGSRVDRVDVTDIGVTGSSEGFVVRPRG